MKKKLLTKTGGQVLQGFCNEVALYNHLYFGFKKNHQKFGET